MIKKFEEHRKMNENLGINFKEEVESLYHTFNYINELSDEGYVDKYLNLEEGLELEDLGQLGEQYTSIEDVKDVLQTAKQIITWLNIDKEFD